MSQDMPVTHNARCLLPQISASDIITHRSCHVQILLLSSNLIPFAPLALSFCAYGSYSEMFPQPRTHFSLRNYCIIMATITCKIANIPKVVKRYYGNKITSPSRKKRVDWYLTLPSRES